MFDVYKNNFFFSYVCVFELETFPWVVSQNIMSQEGRLETRMFQLTVSVPGDLSAECQDKIVEYLKKTTIMHHIVIEYGSEGTHRHLHASAV